MAAATMILVLTLVSPAHQSPVAMLISSEGSPDYLFHALFNITIFKQFYVCMTDMRFKCILNWKNEFEKTYYRNTDRWVVRVDQFEITPEMDQVQGNNFTCNNDQRTSTITCERSTNQYPGQLYQQSFNLRDTRCDKSCVTICWKLNDERLIYHTETDNIDVCKAPCTPPTTASAIPATDNSGAQTDSNTSLIIGVICGVLVFVVAVIVVAVVMWRRRQLCITNCKDPSGRFRPSFSSEPVQGAASNTRLAEINSYQSSELDTAVQDDEGDYSYIPDSATNNGTAGYSNVVVVPMSIDEYSLAHNVSSLNESEVTEQQQTVYSKLGQNVAVKVNPYNCFSESHDASEDDSSSGQDFSQTPFP